MTGEEKLLEMIRRGWCIKVSYQQGLETWDLEAAISPWDLKKGEKVYLLYGIANSLLEALERVEPQLAIWQIEYYADMLTKCVETAKPKIIKKISELSIIAERSNAG